MRARVRLCLRLDLRLKGVIWGQPELGAGILNAALPKRTDFQLTNNFAVRVLPVAPDGDLTPPVKPTASFICLLCKRDLLYRPVLSVTKRNK